MLMILYGATAEMGFKSREYLINKGFELVEKYYYAPSTPEVTTLYGKRNFVSKSEFLENTDSLFRYEIGGMMAGFNQQQISDAVCNKKNMLLTLSAKDIAFLAEIKRVYADSVCLIYAYIDDETLKNIVSKLDGITLDEVNVRLKTGMDIKQCYIQYQSIFDNVVIYGGECSIFDYQSLYRQFDRVIGAYTIENDVDMHYADVFISYTVKDAKRCEQIRTALIKKGISVFDDQQLSIGTEWVVAIEKAIQNAKIVIPIITDNSLSSEYVFHETCFALDCAEKNGSLIVPVYDNEIDLNSMSGLNEKLKFWNGIFIENEKYEDAANKIAEKVFELLSVDVKLKSFSKQVESYLCLKMYEQAKSLQEAHLKLCYEVFSESKETIIDLEECTLSHIKLISILLDMGKYQEALEQTIMALNQSDYGDTYDILIDQFLLCCAYLGKNADAVSEIALRYLDEFHMHNSEFFRSDRMQSYVQSRINNILDRFDNALNVVELNRKTTQQDSVQTDNENKIAEHAELAIVLFEDLIKKHSKGLSRHDLILGYERILNYCKHIGVRGEVANKCIKRIAELSSCEESTDPGEGSIATEALKIYLGQAIPMSGTYDVFLSYKSEDEVLAKKVFDYLSRSGKEVFFAKETLAHLGESKYAKMIFEAIDRSRHMIVISSNPDYLKTSWVWDEWSTFDNEIRERRKNGNLLLLLTDDIAAEKGRLPTQLRQKEIVKMSEFRTRILSFLR